MRQITANIIAVGILLGNALLLFVFHKMILERIKIRWLRYMLGMIFAYGILMCLMRWSMHDNDINIAFQKARIFRNFTDTGIVPYVIPAMYSVYLVGYFEKDRDWKRIRAMMLSVFFNGILAFFGAMVYYSHLKGDSYAKIFARLRASAAYIDPKSMMPFVGILALFYFFIKWNYFKYNKK